MKRGDRVTLHHSERGMVLGPIMLELDAQRGRDVLAVYIPGSGMHPLEELTGEDGGWTVAPASDPVAGVTAEVQRSEFDGAALVQIDTDSGVGRVRVFLNDGAIWDGDPETHHHHECGCVQ